MNHLFLCRFIMEEVSTNLDRPSSLSGRIRAELERMILDGTLAAGERLNEVALAKRLGVSRGPVREAARSLERLGLVTVILNRGAFVRTVPLDEALDCYALNGLLFGFGCAQLAATITAAQALELRGLFVGMEAAVEATDREGFFALNIRFHEQIMAYSRNRQAEAVYLEQTRKLMLFRRRSFDRSSSMAESNAEHRRILDALLAGDADLARRYAEEHSRSGRARFLSSIDTDHSVSHVSE
jgi:DNA-binding GntR family transcriptional regulator